MKNFKNILTVIAIFAIGSVNAKQVLQKNQPATTQPIVQPEIKPITPITTQNPNFYDEETKMIKQDYLNERIDSLLKKGNSQKQIIRILNKELMRSMHLEWKKRNIKNTASLAENIQQQIKDAVVDAIK
jgi:hypothetical protein